MSTPAFIRELDTTLPVCSQYLLHGNVRDLYLADVDGTVRPLPMVDLLWHVLEPAGYRAVLQYDPVSGVRVHPDESRPVMSDLFGSELERQPPSFDRLARLVAAIARPDADRPVRTALLVDYASRLAVNPERLELDERDFYLACVKHCQEATPLLLPDHERSGPLFNPVIWLLDREQDFPSWYSADNERIRAIAVPWPDLGDRLTVAEKLIKVFGSEPGAGEPFAAQSDGMSLRAMTSVTMLARDRGLSAARLPDAVRTFRLGVVDNPWQRTHLRRRISDQADALHDRVIGQPVAVEKTLDILKRAVIGLSGAQTSSAGSRPRGVLFFAGPTGVGKTELAKAVAGLVFGDEAAYLRFDMSEFAAEHAGDRLIGAPPGYVGYESGGELTDAVRRQPFRVILFDEVEKAHPRILDKFLQVLEDGRLTDGRGNTAYFSESILIFTSNLGTGDLSPADGTPYEEVERHIRAAVQRHFNHELGRPELLNRFGDNIVVFGFIDPATAQRIFEGQLSNILDRVKRELEVTVTLSETAVERLRAWCVSDLEHGGRGIGSALETNLINPLARELFAADPAPGGEVTIVDLERDGSHAKVVLL